MIKFIVDIEKQKRYEEYDCYEPASVEILPSIEEDGVVFIFNDKENYKINKRDIEQIIRVLCEIK